MLTRALASLVTLLALATGCSFELGSSTEGAEGRASFAYTGSCLFGCAIDHPVMAGGSARISIFGDGLPEVVGQSSDDGVLTVKTEHSVSCCTKTPTSSTCSTPEEGGTCPSGTTRTVSQWMNVVGHAPGVARLSLFKPGGELVDSIDIPVADAAKVTLHVADASLERVDLAIGAGKILDAYPHDAKGQPLESSGLRFVVTDPTIASFNDPAWFMGNPAGVSEIEPGGLFTTATLRGRKAGETTLRVQAGSFSQTFPVTVK